MSKNKIKEARQLRSKKRRPLTSSKKGSATGTYAFDKSTGRLVKLSSRIPGLSKSDGGGDFDEGNSNKDGYLGGSDGDMDSE